MLISYKKYKKVIRIINKLHWFGFDTYIVGGFVRDYIMGIPSHDIDLATKATPDEIKLIFPQVQYGFGTAFKVSIVDGVEVATFRKDSYFGQNDKDCKITYAATIKEDLSRRDFTINAIAMDIIHKILIDPFNGIQDIKNKVIRFVGNPEDRIQEDQCRILRGLRICAKINGTIEENSLEVMKFKTEKQIKQFECFVPIERRQLEVWKTIKTAKKSSIFFRLLKYIGLHEIILPSLYDKTDIDGGRHHNETIFDHCMSCGDHISINRPHAKFAGYLHDIGKPMAMELDTDGNATFKGHEKLSFEFTEIDLKNLKFSTRDIEIISRLVKFHMRTMESSKSIRKILAVLKEHRLCWLDYLRIKIADRHGNQKKPDFDIFEIKKRINKFIDITLEQIPIDTKSLKINGNDVMAVYELPPSRKVGEILKEIFEKVLNEELINDKEILVSFMKTDKLERNKT